MTELDTSATGFGADLTQRYTKLVSEHLSPAQSGAAGLRALPGTASAMASTQAAWRFYHNPGLSLPQVFAPVLAATLQGIDQSCDQYALVVCDWCNFHYKQHTRKKDRVTLSQNQDLGYELFSGLTLSDRDGRPLGPLWHELRARDGVHSTHSNQLRQPVSVLDELHHNFYHTHQLVTKKSPVFIIDAEADSVAHMRQCDREGYLFLFRADAISTAMYQEESRKLSEVGADLGQAGKFRFTRNIKFKGQSLQQWVAETDIVITRDARPQRKGEKRRKVPGPPLSLRLIVSELRDHSGQVLSVWYLLTNVPSSVSYQQIVQWYCWRWKIESYHKLLKSSGQEVEHWQQCSAEAVARRLAVACMACLIVWHLERDSSEEAARLRELLIRLSGRQMHYGTSFTAPALLAGLWVLLSMLDILETHDILELRELVRAIIPTKKHAINAV